jgi:alkaline phosphatase D
MGRPAKTTRPSTPAVGTSRRGFFKTTGGTAAALAATPLLSLTAQAQNAGPRFQHGVASGDPLSDRVILWTRVTPTSPVSVVNVSYVVARDPGLTQVVVRGSTKTNAARDYTVKVDPTGLQPGTTYYYRFTAIGQDSPIGRTRTLPVANTQRVRMAVVSCSNHAFGLFNVYRRVAARADLDLVVHLGDYLYEYGPSVYGSLRTPEPPNEMVTLSDYRLRHAQYKRDADSQAMHRQHAFVCIWDDHEITNDSWVDGAQNHQPATEGSWTDRVNVGLQAYYEWMPVRVPDVAQKRRNQRSFICGDLLELVMLEERLSARSEQLPATIPVPGFGNGFVQAGAFADPTRTLLGAEQEAWLSTRLRSTHARWKLLGQGVMFAQLKAQGAPLAAGGGVFLNSDQWDGYQPARNRIYNVIKGDETHPRVNNVVVLTGDIHSSWAADLAQDPNNPNLATGGYNPATGEGSQAVEFVGTSVSSPGIDSDTTGAIANTLRAINPHFKYINLHQRGYMLLDVNPQRVVCEYWFVDTVASVSNIETFATAFEVQQGSNRLQASVQTTSAANPPALAP